MRKFFEFVRRERLYILLLIFVLLITFLVAVPGEARAKKHVAGKALKGEVGTGAPFERLDKEKVDMLLRENKPLALLLSLTSLLIMALLLLGVLVDIMLISFKLSKKKLITATYAGGRAGWGLVDVARVVILFLFFGYMLVLTESALLDVFPAVKDDNFRMMFNSSILDILALVLIIYFVARQHGERLVEIGLSLKNFAKNVFYGIAGYIAAIPIFAIALILVTVAVNITKYVPVRQPVVDLFLKEKDVVFLTYTSVFAAVVGPIIEELFFRGFFYKALKKYIGIFWSMLATAAVFAVLHTNVVGFLPIMVLGMLLAYLYEKTGTLVAPITVHVIHNLTMVFFVFLLKQVSA